jgi:hypothetical protein
MCGTAPKKYFFLAVINLSNTDGVGNKRIEIFETKTRNSYLLLRGNGRQFSTQGNQNGPGTGGQTSQATDQLRN